MKRIFFIVFLFFMANFQFQERVDAYSLSVHERITYKTLEQNKTIINNYLKNIGLNNGVDETLTNSPFKKTVSEWMLRGSWMEDFDVTILWSHFYDPLTNKGYSVGGVEIGQSAYDRANDLPNYGPWVWARKRLYDGLTQTDKSLKEKYLGIAFQALGSAMHLVQDVSVPAHTRNDFHLPLVDEEPYETYTGKHYNDADFISNYTAIAFPLWNQSTSPNAPRQFWDTDTYDGYNASAGINQGLAEYTNANFFSEDTIFNAAYPYPKESSTDLQSYINQNKLPETVIGEDNIPDTSFYIKKISDGETVDHFVKPGYLTKEALDMGLTISYLTYTLDDVCYKDYASLLIPRAVGYSAGLLDYFFRGTLEITMPDAYIYSITDGSVIPHQFTRLKAKVKNTTPNEEIQNGIIHAVARYKKRIDYQPDLSTDPPTAASREADFSYSVSAPIVITSLSSTTPAEFTFDFTSSPIPAGITDLYLHVVFKGTLGNEKDIAVAVGIKDLNEPQHFSTWNATDYIYLDKILRTADEIRNNPTLLDRVDIDNDGIVNELDIGEPYIDPYDVTTMVAFYPTGVTPTIYNATYTPLPPGRYGRIILLTDMPEFYIRIHRESTNPQLSNTDADYLFSGVTNQENNGIFENTQVTTFRGIIQHHWSAYAWYFGDPDGISTAPWPPPANTNPSPTNTMYP